MVRAAPPVITPPEIGTLAVPLFPPPFEKVRVHVPVPAKIPPFVYVPEAIDAFWK
jgi:hypothetical protein